MIYETINPEQKDISTSQIHNDIDSRVTDNFYGLTARNGNVETVVGDLSDDDISAIESYLNCDLIEVGT